MSQTTFSTRIDADLKRELEKICKELGMSLTTAFTIFAKTVVRERRIPFDLNLNKNFKNNYQWAEQEKIVLNQTDFQKFIEACEDNDWEISAEILDAVNGAKEFQ